MSDDHVNKGAALGAVAAMVIGLLLVFIGARLLGDVASATTSVSIYAYQYGDAVIIYSSTCGIVGGLLIVGSVVAIWRAVRRPPTGLPLPGFPVTSTVVSP